MVIRKWVGVGDTEWVEKVHWWAAYLWFWWLVWCSVQQVVSAWACLSVFLAFLACICSSNCYGLHQFFWLAQPSLGQQSWGWRHSIRMGQWWGGMGDSRMGLWENLGSGIVQQAGGSLPYSSDWYGLHLGSRSQQKLGTGSQQWGRQWGGVWVSGMGLWELNLGTGAVELAGR